VRAFGVGIAERDQRHARNSPHLACQAVASGVKAAVLDLDEDQATTLKWAKRRREKGVEAPIALAANAVTLKPTLRRLKSEGFDWVFLDLPGRSAAVASAGLVAADMILVPCRPLDVDIEASVPTIHSAKLAGKRYAYLMNIVPARHDKQRAQHMAGTLEALGHPVCPAFIAQRIIVADAIAKGSSVGESHPRSESVAEFKRLFQWVDKEIPQ
jgi:chromosome partitioning protein